MRSRSTPGNGTALCIVLTAMGALSACSAGETTDKPAAAAAPAVAACSTPTDSILGLAAEKFAKQVSPIPHRFLVPVGTDSALPATSYWGLQTTGATLNMLPKDTAQHKKAIQQLAPGGSYVLLLANYHGQRTLPDGRIAVEFSGHYLTGKDKGKVLPRTIVLFSCQATGAGRVVVQPAGSTA